MSAGRLQHTRKLARAYRKLERAEAAVRAAKREFDEVFQPWAAGSSIERAEVRKMLVLAGHIE